MGLFSRSQKPSVEKQGPAVGNPGPQVSPDVWLPAAKGLYDADMIELGPNFNLFEVTLAPGLDTEVKESAKAAWQSHLWPACSDPYRFVASLLLAVTIYDIAKRNTDSQRAQAEFLQADWFQNECCRWDVCLSAGLFMEDGLAEPIRGTFQSFGLPISAGAALAENVRLGLAAVAALAIPGGVLPAGSSDDLLICLASHYHSERVPEVVERMLLP